MAAWVSGWQRAGMGAAIVAALAAISASPASAQTSSQASALAAAHPGDVAWMLTATVLVLAMIMPGLALFYGGLVRAKNLVSIFSQIFVVTAIGMVLWLLIGYSLTFSDGGAANRWIGGFGKAFLQGVTPASLVETFSVGVAIPELIFAAFQMTFACITAALVLGGVAERARFGAVIIFALAWPVLVYYPIAHMVWWWGGPSMAADPAQADALAAGAGWIWSFGALDFAGGTVVHINAGIAALVGALILGPRSRYRREPMPPHNLALTLVGAGLLWVGWIGFNAGSNLESNASAALALLNTLVAPAGGALSWMALEWLIKRKPSLLGLASGAVSGLVAVTPAAGYAGPVGALLLGMAAGPICMLACSSLKNALGYDDSLDVFGIHGVGGIVGALGTAVVVAPGWGGTGVLNYATGAFEYAGLAAQTWAQTQAVLVTIAWSTIGSGIVWGIARALTGGRVSREIEAEGVDYAEHGEAAYHN